MLQTKIHRIFVVFSPMMLSTHSTYISFIVHSCTYKYKTKCTYCIRKNHLLCSILCVQVATNIQLQPGGCIDLDPSPIQLITPGCLINLFSVFTVTTGQYID